MALLTPPELLSLVNQSIDKLNLDKKPVRLYEPIRYMLSMGGKRIRPVMCLMACDMFGGDVQMAMPAALSLEIFHNFTLLHDDIMDKAEMRRNLDCVHIRWNDNVAILSGDAMQIMAFDGLKDLPDHLFRESIRLFSNTALAVCEGQQYDMDFETRDLVSEADYLEMIRLKTGVLMGTSLKLGALVGNASPSDAESLYHFGLHTGIAFQLQDDLLDVYGDSETFGKNIGGDITTNKKTYLLIQALKTADSKTRTQLEYWLNLKEFQPEEKIRAVTAIFNQTNVRNICQQEMDLHLNKALDCLEAVNVPQNRKEPLMKLAADLMNRTF